MACETIVSPITSAIAAVRPRPCLPHCCGSLIASASALLPDCIHFSCGSLIMSASTSFPDRVHFSSAALRSHLLQLSCPQITSASAQLPSDCIHVTCCSRIVSARSLSLSGSFQPLQLPIVLAQSSADFTVCR